MELYLTPKPGLVDLSDSGSHSDLSLALMEQSIHCISDYVDEIVASLKQDEAFACQKEIAIRAEKRLFDHLGTNTHKGYIFLSGMLLIARWHTNSPDEHALRKTLSSLSENFFSSVELQATNGQRARKKFGSGGIVQEAINGYPALFEAALPAYRESRERGGCHKIASFSMLARLMQTVDDTTTLHRGGLAGLDQVRRDGRTLEEIIMRGENYIPFLEDLNRTYIRMNLTFGGVADMLGLAFACLLAAGDILAEDETEGCSQHQAT